MMTKANRKIPTYEDVTQIYTYLYQAVGVVPFARPSRSSTMLSSILAIYFQWASMVNCTMNIGDGVRRLICDEFEIAVVFEVLFSLSLSLRFVIIYCERVKFTRLMGVCAELWKLLVDEEPRLVKSFEIEVRYLMYYNTFSTVVAVVFYIVTAQIVRLPPAEVNGTERRILPFRFYVDVQEQPWFDIVSILVDVVSFSVTMVIAAVETAGPFFIMMACAYLRSIQNRLLAMVETNTSSFDVSLDNRMIQFKENHTNHLSTRNVIECVQFHQKILTFCQNVEMLTRSLFIFQVMSTAYTISLIGLRLLKHDPNSFKYVPLLLLNLLQFFSCSWFSEHLLTESKAIVNAAYSATLMHPEYKSVANRALLFMMMRAGRPLQMTAGGYINLSLETFKQMGMSAISFFTVLRSMDN